MRIRTIPILALIALCGLLVSNATFAKDKQHRALGHSYSNSHHSGHLGYYNQRKHKKHYSYKSYSKYRNNTYYRGQHNKYYYVPRYSHKSYSKYRNNKHNNHNYRNSHYQKSCHPVSKNVIDKYGHHRQVGGTMCYNKYGQSYIVSGSRYYKH